MQDELDVMIQIRGLMERVDNKQRAVIVRWFVNRFGRPPADEDSPFAGVGHLNDLDEFVVTLQDPCGNSVNDAAVRATCALIYAYCELTKQPSLSSTRFLVPTLKRLGLYTGSTRAALNRQELVVREGDQMSLTDDGKEYAREVIEQIQDPLFQGRLNIQSHVQRSGEGQTGVL